MIAFVLLLNISVAALILIFHAPGKLDRKTRVAIGAVFAFLYVFTVLAGTVCAIDRMHYRHIVYNGYYPYYYEETAPYEDATTFYEDGGVYYYYDDSGEPSEYYYEGFYDDGMYIEVPEFYVGEPVEPIDGSEVLPGEFYTVEPEEAEESIPPISDGI